MNRVWRCTRERMVLAAVAPLSRLWSRDKDTCAVLTYHHVSPARGADPDMLTVSPSQFRKQLTGLLRLGYRPMSLRELVMNWRDESRPLPNKSFAIVFDDGYENVFQHAWPTLKELSIPATICLVTSWLDQGPPDLIGDLGYPVDPEHWRPLRTEQCREMQCSGLVELGSHTHTHSDSRGQTTHFRDDLLRSLEALRTIFGVEQPVLSFPYGNVDEAMLPIVNECGVLCALTAECGLVHRHHSLHQWPRLGGTNFDTPRSLAAKIDGWYDLCLSLGRSVRA